MSRTLYACAHAAEFPAQALLRLRDDLHHPTNKDPFVGAPDLRARPVVVLEGQAPRETVCSLNRQALLRGAAPGMTRLEIENLGGLTLLARSAEGEAAARAVFLECVAQFSPRIEEVSQEASRGIACAFVLDIAGTERLFGPSQQLAARLRAALRAAGFRVSVAVSANYDAARMMAAATRGLTVIPEGGEADALKNLPLTALELDEEHAETFALWGMRTLGELARAPETELVTRLGAAARVWRQLARGEAAHTFEPIEPALTLEEFCAFETPVEQIDSLLFVGARMIDCLVARAEARALSLAAVTVDLKLENGCLHRRVLRPALPSADRKFLLKLLQLEIGAHPPEAAVVALTLAAEAGPSSKVQLGLFVPQMPEPSRLDVTLARLKALVGDDRVGSPALEDTHRSGGFHIEGFASEKLLPTLSAMGPRKRVGQPKSGREAAPARMALRRVRPPVSVWVELLPTLSAKDAERVGHGTFVLSQVSESRPGAPRAFRDAEERFEVMAAYGPWRSSGCWWSDGEWDTEEWDVLATKADGASAACLLIYDRKQSAWRLEAFYD